MNVHGCIVHECPVPRVKGSGFCKAHKVAHNKSAWVKAWNAGKPKASPLRGTNDKPVATAPKGEVGYTPVLDT